MRKSVSQLLERREHLKCDNLGLLLDCLVPEESNSLSKEDIRRQILDNAVGCKSRFQKTSPYGVAFTKWRECLERSGVWNIEIETASPLALGLGVPSRFELGIRLNRTYGAPVIDGSTLKGALRDAAADLLDLDRLSDLDPSDTATEILTAHPNAQALIDVFGSVGGAGSVGFYDSWCVPDNGQSPLMIDVITPHHPEFYKESKNIPLETENPEPHQYLVVRPGVRFLVASNLPNQEWEAPLLMLLHHALKTKGIGAKANQGYGRFKFDHAPRATHTEGAREAQPAATGLPSDGEHVVIGTVTGTTSGAAWVRSDNGFDFKLEGTYGNLQAGTIPQGTRIEATIYVLNQKPQPSRKWKVLP